MSRKTANPRVNAPKKPLVEKRVVAAKPVVSKAAGKFFEGVGRRKTAVARVRLFPGQNVFLVNEQPCEKYFSHSFLQKIVNSVFEQVTGAGALGVRILVRGGGLNAQAEACRHGLARAMVKYLPDTDKLLKKSGFLTRDPRMRERKKFGLKRARKGPQWQKR